MTADATCMEIWQELRRLRDIPPPSSNHNKNSGQGQGSAFYKDFAAFAACNKVRVVIGRCSELPRGEFLDLFTRLVKGSQLEELFDLLKSSRRDQHPALQYACLVALHGVAELSDRRKNLLTRPDIIAELCAVMASPRQLVVTPASAGGTRVEVVNPAAGAITTITGLFTSNGTLEPPYAKLWVEGGAVSAVASCLESHAAFDRTDPVSTDLPLCFFLIATSLLAGAAESVSEQDKIKLASAWLKVFVEATIWVSDEASDLLADFFTRPNWLKGVVKRIPEHLRARTVESAGACVHGEVGGGGVSGGGWTRDKAARLALALLCGNPCCWDERGVLVGRRCAGPGCDRVQKCGDLGERSGSGGGAHPAGDAAGHAAGDAAGDTAGNDRGKQENVSPFKRCSQCHAVAYCSRQCQAVHWKKGHRRACTLLRA